mmetsp:Transcript_15000/g.38344  ORF Transcript_15000/g.38344 Transcript_15000/m.38344 type:complete len:425 (+) Transcript_15000:1475-2749(+)
MHPLLKRCQPSLLGIRIAQRHHLVEHQPLLIRVQIAAEVAYTLKLKRVARLRLRREAPNPRTHNHRLALRIQVIEPRLLRQGAGILGLEQRLVNPNLSGRRVRRTRDPMKHALGFAGLGGVVGNLELDGVASVIADHVSDRDGVGVAEHGGFAWGQPVVALLVFQTEVGLVNVDRGRQENVVAAKRDVLRVLLHFKLVHIGFVEVGDRHLQGIQNTESSRGRCIKIAAHCVLQLVHANNVVRPRHANLRAESIDRHRGIPSSTHANERRHSRVVPTTDVLLLDELEQFSLRYDGALQGEARKLPHVGPVEIKRRNEPVVRIAADFELKGTQRVGHPLEGIDEAVGVIVRRVNTPLVTASRVLRIFDAVRNGVAHAWVVALHVDLHAERDRALVKQTLAHVSKKLEVLLDGAVAPRAVLLVLASL